MRGTDDEEGSLRSVLLANEVGAVAVLRKKNMGHAPIAVEDANAESSLHRVKRWNESNVHRTINCGLMARDVHSPAVALLS